MLWLGLLARDTGIPASEHLQIQDGVVALNFNLAVTLRLSRYDREKEKANQKFWVSLVAGSEEASKLDEPDEIDPYDFIANDPYADHNTVIN